jgi:hypothetical protein
MVRFTTEGDPLETEKATTLRGAHEILRAIECIAIGPQYRHLLKSRPSDVMLLHTRTQRTGGKA